MGSPGEAEQPCQDCTKAAHWLSLDLVGLLAGVCGINTFPYLLPQQATDLSVPIRNSCMGRARMLCVEGRAERDTSCRSAFGMSQKKHLKRQRFVLLPSHTEEQYKHRDDQNAVCTLSMEMNRSPRAELSYHLLHTAGCGSRKIGWDKGSTEKLVLPPTTIYLPFPESTSPFCGSKIKPQL